MPLKANSQHTDQAKLQDPWPISKEKPGNQAAAVGLNLGAIKALNAQETITHGDVFQLQRTLGNRATGRILSELPPSPQSPAPSQSGSKALPVQLRSGLEGLSGMDLSAVQVHRASAKPAQLQAHAFTQGNNIHLGPGQDRHLPHEAWHVVQQRQGRVSATDTVNGVPLNDNPALEAEADRMGSRAMQMKVKRPIWDISPSPSSFQATRPVQLKKTRKPTDILEKQELITELGDIVEQKILKTGMTLDAKVDAIWDHATRLYTKNEGKGQGYSRNLDDLVKKYQDTTIKVGETTTPKNQVITSNTAKRTGYDDKFSKNYATTIEKLATGPYQVNTKGYDPDTSAKPTVNPGGSTGDYSNQVNLATGTIKAAWNMAAKVHKWDWKKITIRDQAIKANKGLNNSEILWQQAKLAAEEEHKGTGDKTTRDAQVAATLKKLKKISRKSVVNSETQETVYMAYDEGEKWNQEKDWNPGSSEFNAVLGTPNAKSSAFFLMDHMDQLEKKIEKIKATDKGDLDIEFKDI